jgi:hypothetical protein
LKSAVLAIRQEDTVDITVRVFEQFTPYAATQGQKI